MSRRINDLMLAELENQFRDIKETGCVVANYEGMAADDARRARNSIRMAGGRMTVVKNALFSLALQRLGAQEVASLLKGTIAIIQAQNAPAAARAFKDASEICPALRLRGGYVEGKVVDAARVEKLAQIPSRETLLAQLAGMLKAPLRRLAYGLLSRPRAFVRGLNILRERMEEENSSKQEV
ncbi:MAG: 50S ribosomal protein L10 [Planctomycetes bacterium]|nr:50S ribosomal protein L10 [Planctomycetota bacterium]